MTSTNPKKQPSPDVTTINRSITQPEVLPPPALFRATRIFPKQKTNLVGMYESRCMNDLCANTIVFFSSSSFKK